jgi:hypothetical protein
MASKLAFGAAAAGAAGVSVLASRKPAVVSYSPGGETYGVDYFLRAGLAGGER